MARQRPSTNHQDPLEDNSISPGVSPTSSALRYFPISFDLLSRTSPGLQQEPCGFTHTFPHLHTTTLVSSASYGHWN